MQRIYENEHILTRISMYLEPKDIISFLYLKNYIKAIFIYIF